MVAPLCRCSHTALQFSEKRGSATECANVAVITWEVISHCCQRCRPYSIQRWSCQNPIYVCTSRLDDFIDLWQIFQCRWLRNFNFLVEDWIAFSRLVLDKIGRLTDFHWYLFWLRLKSTFIFSCKRAYSPQNWRKYRIAETCLGLNSKRFIRAHNLKLT